MTGNPTIQLHVYELRDLLDRAESHIRTIETRLIAALQARRKKMNRFQLWWYGDPLEKIREIERGEGWHPGAYFRRAEMPVLYDICREYGSSRPVTVGADLIEKVLWIARQAGETF